MKALYTLHRILRIDFGTAASIFALLLLCQFPAWGQSATYKIHLDFDRPLHATVEAHLQAPDGAIFTARHAGGYAWWNFIKNVRQLRDDGTSVFLQSTGEGRWAIPVATAA